MKGTRLNRLMWVGATLMLSVAGIESARATGIEKARAFRQGLRGNTRIAAGEAHSLAISKDGQVMAWGENGFGQIGEGATGTVQLEPAKVPDMLNAIEVAAGANHSLALLANGQVWAWGRNDEGQLGDGSWIDRSSPVWVNKIDCSMGVVSIAAGGAHSLALCDDGSLWAWGRGVDGQLGDGGWTNRYLPVRVELDEIVKIAAGAFHSFAVLASGEIAAWGANDCGQLGDGSFSPAGRPILIGLDRVVAIAGGAAHSLALLADGQLAAWGSNEWGQLGDGSYEKRAWPISVSTGPIIAIAAGQDQSLAIRMDGTLLAWGWDINQAFISVPTEVNLDRPVTEVAAGAHHAFTIDGHAAIWAWGQNSNGQLGYGATIDMVDPIRIYQLDGVLGRTSADANSYRMQAIRADATLWEWGEIGRNGFLPSRSTSIPAIKALATGGSHELALRADGTVWSRGRNDYGQLGIGTDSPRSPPVPG